MRHNLCKLPHDSCYVESSQIFGNNNTQMINRCAENTTTWSKAVVFRGHVIMS
jgi:hypothetical protein